jgi:hypothetical protein
MTHSVNTWEQLGWAVVYGVWLIFIKPSTSDFMISIQAGLGQLSALSALYLSWADGPLYGLTIITGVICYLTARHFYDAFDESYSRLLSYLWGYFGAALAWLSVHWLLFYGVFAQPTILLTVIGYGIGTMYYWDHNEKLTSFVKRQLILVMVVIVMIVIIFSDWGSKVV